jgi:hypothetical protein
MRGLLVIWFDDVPMVSPGYTSAGRCKRSDTRPAVDFCLIVTGLHIACHVCAVCAADAVLRSSVACCVLKEINAQKGTARSSKQDTVLQSALVVPG